MAVINIIILISFIVIKEDREKNKKQNMFIIFSHFKCSSKCILYWVAEI